MSFYSSIMTKQLYYPYLQNNIESVQQFIKIRQMSYTTDIDSEDKLKELNAYQDTLDVFLHILILRLPSAFILINMTLMIWLVQTIFSNPASDSVPRSLYYFNSFLAGLPLIDLKITGDNNCEIGYQPIILKTFPAIINESINHNNLTRWKNYNIFCQKVSEEFGNFSGECLYPEFYCSGLCVNQSVQCPITNIRQIYYTQALDKNETLLSVSQDKMYKYVISREDKQTFIIGIRAMYQYRCADQYNYFDTYTYFDQYWNTTKMCGDEGFLSSQIFHSFDQMGTAEFFFQNGIWGEDINQSTGKSVTDVGSIFKLNFKNKTAQCRAAQLEARNIQNQVLNISMKPQFSKLLLIMSFILFTFSWAWLVAFYCFCQHNTMEKNSVVILLAIVQFIVIAFVYYQNYKLLQTEIKINLIASCIDSSLPAFQQWSFQVSNRSPLICIMYACSCFLLLQIISYCVSYCLYQPYAFQKVAHQILNQLNHRDLVQSRH